MTRNSFAVAFLLSAASFLGNASGYLLVPDPPLATPLNDETYDDFLNSQDKVGIVFRYPSDMDLSASLVEFSIVTKIMENNPACKFGMYPVQISATSPSELKKPTLTYMKDGVMNNYTGSTAKIAEMLAWITKERICEMRISNMEMAKYYVRSLEQGHVHTYLLLQSGKYNDKLAKKVYDTVISTGLRVPFMVVDEPDILKYILKLYHVNDGAVTKDAVLVARNIITTNGLQFYMDNPDDKEKLRSFLIREMVPMIHNTNSYMLSELFTMNKILIYIYTKAAEIDTWLDLVWLNKFTRKHNDRFLFIHSKGDPAVEKHLNELLVIDADYVDTAVRAFELHPERSEFVKYKPLDLKDGTITQAKLINFIRDLRNGRIRHFIKSEPAVPEKINTGIVKTIVGEDFHHRVIDSDEDVLVLFYTPWSGHCHNAKRVFRDLGRRVKGHGSLVIGMFDAFNNEVENLKFENYPTVMFYPHGAKQEPIKYEGTISIEPLAEFLERECKKRYVNSSFIIGRELTEEQLFEMHSEL